MKTFFRLIQRALLSVMIFFFLFFFQMYLVDFDVAICEPVHDVDTVLVNS